MKICKYLIAINILLMVMISCGGVTGNIKKYEFDISAAELKMFVESAYSNHPEWVPPKDSLKRSEGKYYNTEHDEYNLYIIDKEPYLLHFSIMKEIDSLRPFSRIALLTGAKFGDVLPFATEMNRAERTKYKTIFENYFLKELNKLIKE